MTSVAEKPKTVRNSSPSPQPRSPKAGSSSGAAGVGSSSRLTHQSSTGSLLGSMRSSRDRDIMDLVPSAAECSYAACFCEENVWKLCDHVQTTTPNELAKAFVIFVSNKKQVNWNQSQRCSCSLHDFLSGSVIRCARLVLSPAHVNKKNAI